jgi:hypothetical protein
MELGDSDPRDEHSTLGNDNGNTRGKYVIGMIHMKKTGFHGKLTHRMKNKLPVIKLLAKKPSVRGLTKRSFWES